MKKEFISRWTLSKPLHLLENDKKYKKYNKQLKKHGFCDSETWDFRSVISEFILPRLKRFKEVTNGYPPELTFKEWKNILDKMIFAFEWVSIYNNLDLNQKEINDGFKKYNEGMDLFSKYFMNLWW